MKSNITNKLGWAGLSKIALDRFRVYLTYIQMLMIVKLYLNQEGFSWWFLLFIPGSLLVIYLDIRYMYRGEQRASFDVHPYFPKLVSDIEKIKSHLGIARESSNQKVENGCVMPKQFAKGLDSAAWFMSTGDK